jgi:type IV secretory pathway VirB10-like protein
MFKFWSKHTFTATSLAISAFLIASACQAQYVWVDEKGNKQFSDQPPPANISKDKIIKAPTRNASATSSTATPPGAPPAGNAGAANEQLKKPVTTASKNEDYNKRKAEQEEKEKKSAAEQQANSDKAKNCERARAYQKTLESGQRIANTAANGEKNILNDAQREQELKDTQRSLSDCK